MYIDYYTYYIRNTKTNLQFVYQSFQNMVTAKCRQRLKESAFMNLVSGKALIVTLDIYYHVLQQQNLGDRTISSCIIIEKSTLWLNG